MSWFGIKVVIHGYSALLSRVAVVVRKMSVQGRVWGPNTLH